jgi:hypothetical protein
MPKVQRNQFYQDEVLLEVLHDPGPFTDGEETQG